MNKLFYLYLLLLIPITTQAQYGAQQIISTTTERPYLSIPFDIDDDGLTDVLTSGLEEFKMSWYKNIDGLNFGSEIIINETPVYYLSIDFVDINNDGNDDILYLSNNSRYIAWLENLDGLGNFSSEQIINEIVSATSIIPTDFDNDGDQDLIVAAANASSGWMSWFENLDGQGTFSEENILLQNSNEYSKIMLTDIDNDGLLDLLATDYVYAEGKIFWYKNLGNTTFDSMQIIYQFDFFQSGGTNITGFQHTDINGDEKKDIIFTSEDDDGLVNSFWLENLDNQGSFGDLQFIVDLRHQYLFYDLDNDSDNDILFWNRFSNSLAWKKNEDGLGTFSAFQTISSEINFIADAKAADFDNDGFLDIVSASISDNKVAWYKFLGLSNDEFHQQQLTVYPNPTATTITLETPYEISEINITNLQGKVVNSGFSTKIIDISHLETGLYFLSVSFNNGVQVVKKIMKQ